MQHMLGQQIISLYLLWTAPALTAKSGGVEGSGPGTCYLRRCAKWRDRR